LKYLVLGNGDITSCIIIVGVIIDRYHCVQSIITAAELHDHQHMIIRCASIEQLRQWRFGAKGF